MVGKKRYNGVLGDDFKWHKSAFLYNCSMVSIK